MVLDKKTGEAVLVDWATALPEERIRYETYGEIPFGTDNYTAPETILVQDYTRRGHEGPSTIGRQTDIYAVGKILGELLVGRRQQDMTCTLEHAMQEKDIDPKLIAIVEKATRPNPAERYQTAEEMRTVLLPYLPKSAEEKEKIRTSLKELAIIK